MAGNLYSDEFNAACEDARYNPLTQKCLHDALHRVFHKHDDRRAISSPVSVLGTRFVGDNKPLEQDLEHRMKELKELNEEFIDLNITNNEHVVESRLCFWFNFAKLFKSTAAKLQTDQLNKDLHFKYPSTITRTIKMEDFLKSYESPAGVTEEKIA